MKNELVVNIIVELFDNMPLHRDNFAKLIAEKYHDGLRFHRIIKDCIIQGGDLLSFDESKRMLHDTGGPNYRIPAEIKHPNKRGIIAAARDNNPQRVSSGSQFHINLWNFFSDNCASRLYYVWQGN